MSESSLNSGYIGKNQLSVLRRGVYNIRKHHLERRSGNLLATAFVPPAIDLLTDLSAYWRMDELSGTREDATASNLDLTDVNTVGNTTGKIGTAAYCVKTNSEYLTVGNNTLLRPGAGSFSFTLWMYPIDASGSQGIISKWDNNTYKEYCLYIGIAGGRFPSFIVTSDGNSDNQLNWSSALTQNAWSFVACVYDYPNTTMKISVNGGNFVTKTHSSGVYSGATTRPLNVGTDQSTSYFNGYIDEVGFWKGRALSQNEVNYLYNSGAGITHPF